MRQGLSILTKPVVRVEEGAEAQYIKVDRSLAFAAPSPAWPDAAIDFEN